MKILFVSDTYYPHLNGVYYFVCRIAPLLQEKGHQVAVIAPSEKQKATLQKLDQIDVYGLPSFPVMYYPRIRFANPFLLARRIKKLLLDIKPDIIHIQDHFLISKKLLEVNRKLKIPVIGTNHFMPENITALIRSNKWKKVIENYLWKNFSKIYNQIPIVTTPTETGARLIRGRLFSKVIPISSGIDFDLFNPFGSTDRVAKKYSLPNKPILLFVGRIDPEKNIEEILHAVEIALRQVDFCFVIVGRGLRKTALEQLAKELNITDHVIFTGFVPDDDLPFFYKLSRCFVIASTAELLSLATLQAMASGLPVIAVKAGALPELVHDKVNGFLFNPGDINLLGQHITNLLSKDDLYRKMREKNLEYVHQHDINKTAVLFENIYTALCVSKTTENFTFKKDKRLLKEPVIHPEWL
jgi:1,2-diacylglycerol 3-alpha-glucosyltransferase